MSKSRPQSSLYRPKRKSRSAATKKVARRAAPLASKYVAVITFNADVSGAKQWTEEESTDMREVMRTARRVVRAQLDGIVDAPRATIDLHAESKDGKILQQYETRQGDGSGFVRFRALEV